MNFLLDTDVLSLTSPVSRFEAPRVEAWRAWVGANSARIHFSAMTVLEIRFGIEKAIAKGAVRKASLLMNWLELAQTIHRARFIPVSNEIAILAGVRLGRATASGASPSIEDAIIAATATHLGYTLLSRNGRHMEALGVRSVDPLDSDFALPN